LYPSVDYRKDRQAQYCLYHWSHHAIQAQYAQYGIDQVLPCNNSSVTSDAVTAVVTAVRCGSPLMLSLVLLVCARMRGVLFSLAQFCGTVLYTQHADLCGSDNRVYAEQASDLYEFYNDTSFVQSDVLYEASNTSFYAQLYALYEPHDIGVSAQVFALYESHSAACQLLLRVPCDPHSIVHDNHVDILYESPDTVLGIQHIAPYEPHDKLYFSQLSRLYWLDNAAFYIHAYMLYRMVAIYLSCFDFWRKIQELQGRVAHIWSIVFEGYQSRSELPFIQVALFLLVVRMQGYISSSGVIKPSLDNHLMIHSF
jgi:hypothetical protein